MNIRQAVMLGLIGLAAPLWAAEKAATPLLNGKKIELARYAKAFVGADNVTVEVASYKTSDGQQGALLLIKGVEGDWDGQVINHSVRPAASGGQDYVTKVDGKNWVTMIMRKKSSDEGSFYELYVPGVKDEIKLVPSDGAAQLTTPEAILKEYQNQQSKG